MAFQLDQVVPWGRSFDEYVDMFALTAEDLTRGILGIADGPAAFNATLTRRGGRVVSVDPVYQLTAAQIRQRIEVTAPRIAEEARRNAGDFVWVRFRSVEDLVAARRRAMDDFLLDFDAGLAAGRYVAAALPTLPFATRSFDLALCSHFLFLYGEQLSLEVHTAAVAELCRVAGEVRVFPLVELGGTESRHLPEIVHRLGAGGCRVTRERTAYEFQKGGNEMLRIVAPPSCGGRE